MCYVRGLFLPILLFHVEMVEPTQSRAEILEDILKNYTSKIAPNFNQDNPTNVTVQLHINSFDSVSEMNMDFSIHMLITQTWVDPRLTFKEPLEKIVFLELDPKNMNEVWVPDLYFVNEKNADFHDVTVPNKLMHIYENGTIQYSASMVGKMYAINTHNTLDGDRRNSVKYNIQDNMVTMTATCPMLLQKFPMDTQICSLYIKSFTYTTENVILGWKPGKAVTLDPEFELPQFHLERDVQLHDCTNRTPDDYTCLEVKFVLTRHLGYYVIQIYVPCVMIVMLSWVSFWLHVDSVPARISLGILTVLTMTTQNDSAQGSLPKVSYIKAIDVWNFLCLVFVFSALLEYSVVNYLSRKKVKLHQRSSNEMPRPDPGDEDDARDSCGCYNRKKYRCSSSRTRPSCYVYVADEIARKRAVTIDRICRWTFPFVFFSLFSIYWCFYLVWAGPQSKKPNYGS